MPTIYRTVEVEVEVDLELSKLETHELLAEIEGRLNAKKHSADHGEIRETLVRLMEAQGAVVAHEDAVPMLEEARWRLQRGEVEDGLICLARVTGVDLSAALPRAH